MPYCKSCHNTFSLTYLNSKGYCHPCAKALGVPPEIPTQSLDAHREIRQPIEPGKYPMRARVTMTTETALDIPIKARLGIVSAERVVGMNLLKDLMLDIRDIVGGNAHAQQNAMQKIKDELFRCLKDDASRLNADMIIGISLNFSQFGNRGQAILATAMGTAVQTSEVRDDDS